MYKLSMPVAVLLGLIEISEAQQYIYTGKGYPDNYDAGNNYINGYDPITLEGCKTKCNNQNACTAIMYG